MVLPCAHLEALTLGDFHVLDELFRGAAGAVSIITREREPVVVIVFFFGVVAQGAGVWRCCEERVGDGATERGQNIRTSVKSI